MGKTKIALIDDSAQIEEKKPSRKERAKSETDKAIGAVENTQKETRGDGEEGSRRVAAASETSEDARRDTEPAGPRVSNKKPQKPGKQKKVRSKKYQEIVKDLDRSKTYPITEAIDMVKKLSYAKFNATIEAHINTAASGIRGLVSLPYASGKKLRILIFGRLPEPSENEGLVFGDDSTIESISQGKVDFDLVITTPEWMPKLAKVAKVLGPRGLMPNPKSGTIISGEDGLKKAVEGFQAGKTEYKTEPKAPVIHLALGKLSQPTGELTQNIQTLLQTIGKTRIKQVRLAPTMGPSVKVDLSSL